MGKKITITFSEKTVELMEKICAKKGFKKSTVVAIAIEEYARKELTLDEKK